MLFRLLSHTILCATEYIAANYFKLACFVFLCFLFLLPLFIFQSVKHFELHFMYEGRKGAIHVLLSFFPHTLEAYFMHFHQTLHKRFL